jgi:hypothetical protein
LILREVPAAEAGAECYGAREGAERFSMQRRMEMPRGRHFAAMEEPKRLLDDIRP